MPTCTAAQVSQACNERYLSSLAALQCGQTLGQTLAQVCRPVRRNKQRYRALRPLEEADGQLLSVVARGEFKINGFRNRDIRVELFGPDPADKKQTRRQAAAVSRKLALLRAHGLIRKVSRTHRWMLSSKGEGLITLIQTAKAADSEKLMKLAA